jgi:hypothetical protein
VPAFAAASIEPSPNRYRRLDLPVLPGGVVEGKVVWTDRRADGQTDSERTTAGVVLVFRHPLSGEQRVITTFGDGGFYLMGLRPGQWEVTVDKRCLGALQASAEVGRFTIQPDSQGDSVDGLVLQLH